VTIFDSVLRTDFQPKRYCEPLFPFMNRCAWPETETIRRTMENWYSEFPVKHQKDLRNRLRSGDDFNYHSAVFELILHATLIRLGFGVDVHPVSPTGEKRPDFWVRDIHPFFVEAAVASGESAQERSANQRMNAVYDALNQLRSPDYFIGIELHGSPAIPPSSRDLRKFLTEKLALLDYALLRTAFEHSGDLECAPRWRYEHAGWVIDFFPIPKPPETRDKRHVRPLAAFLEDAKCRVCGVSRHAEKEGREVWASRCSLRDRGKCHRSR
jgi:hypothetical protein